MVQQAMLSPKVFQLLLVLILIAILISVALTRLQSYQAGLEPLKVDEVTDQLQQGATRLKAEYWLQHNAAGLVVFNKANPIALLAEAPENYLGELRADETAKVKAGYWYFDLDRQLLVYRLKYPQYFAGQPAEISYQLSFSFADSNNDGKFDPAADKALGLELVVKP